MATVGNSNSKRSRLSETAKPMRRDPVDEILAPRRRFGRKSVLGGLFFGSLLVLGVLVVAAPTIIAKTALRDRVLNMAIGLDGEIDTSRGSLSWFSPIVLEDIGIYDRDDKTVIEAQSLTSDTTLLGLITNSSKPGKFTITHPVVNIELREKGSNLEDVLKPLMANKNSKSSTEAVGVKITDGVVNIHDLVTKRKYQLQQVEVDLAMDKQAEAPIQLDASATMPTDADRAKLVVAIRGASEGMDKGTIDCELDAFPLDVAAPFVRRVLPGAELAGLAEVNAKGSWGGGDERQTMTLKGDARVSNFSLAADALGRDRLELERIDLPCAITRQGDELRIEQLALKTDVAQVASEGTFVLKNFSAAELMTALQSDGYRLEGSVDLARLAAMLPDTLRIRQGTEITDGKLTVVFVGEPQREGITWEGRVEAANIQAKADGHRIDWREPVSVQFKAHQTKDGPVVDEAKCSSSFLTLEGSGTLDDLSASGQFDLEKLVAELQQFLDLGGLELAGAGDAKLRWQRKGDDAFTAWADFHATNFALAVPGKRAWRERSLTARVDTEGRLQLTKSGWQLAGVEGAKLTFEAADEKLTATLLEPVEKLSNPVVPVQVDWQGPLGAWLSRIDPWVSTVGWDLDGGGIVKATAVYSTEGVEVRKAVFAAEPFRWSSPGVYIDERRLDAAAAAHWDGIGRRLEVPSSTLECDTVLVKLTDATIKVPDAGAPTMMGTLKYEGDLAQINRWTQDPRSAPTRDMAGKLVGQAVVKRDGRNTSAKMTTTIDGFSIAERVVESLRDVRPRVGDSRPREPGRGWRERQLVIAANATYHDADDVLEISSAEITSDALQASAAGKITSPGTDCVLDLAGKLDYDWQTLAPFWRPYVGQDVNIVGRESRKFMVRGPLPKTGQSLAGMLKPLTAEGGIGWQKAEAYGLPIGDGEIVAKLDHGAIEIQPMDVAVSDGRFTLAPKIRVAPEPGEVRLDKGPLLTQMRFTPEITGKFLKYAAPVLADTAKIDGQFSAELDGGRLPLDDLLSGDVGGRLIIHSVDVQPGPLAEKFLSLGKQVEDLLAGRLPAFGQPSNNKSLLTIQNQEVQVRMVNRRVYHQGMVFTAGKVQIRTVGSVGLDETMDVLAEVVVPNDGIGKGPLADALKGKTLQVPISGTLSKPKLDDGAFQKLAGSLLENAGKGMLLDGFNKQFDGLNKQLDKFLPGK